MTPRIAFNNIEYAGFCYPVCICDSLHGSAVSAQRANLQNLVFAENRQMISLSYAERFSNILGVYRILFVSNPLQIFQSVVAWVSINMINARLVEWVRNKCKRHKPVDVDKGNTFSALKRGCDVSEAVRMGFSYLFRPVARFFSSCSNNQSFYGFYAFSVTDLVCWPIFYFGPDFALQVFYCHKKCAPRDSGNAHRLSALKGCYGVALSRVATPNLSRHPTPSTSNE